MNKARPVNLALTKFRFPVAALVSITHRVTGVLLFAGLALLLYLADLALASEAGFADAAALAETLWVKAMLWTVMSALIYHTIAGVRHVLLDFHVGDTKAAGRLSAQLVIALTVLLAVLAGAWLW